MRRVWSDFQLFQLACLYPYMPAEDVAAIIRLNEAQVKCHAQECQIKKVVKFCKRTWTDDKRAEFIAFYPSHGVAASMAKFGVTKCAISGLARILKLQVDRSVTLRLRGEKMTGRTTATPAEDRYIKKHYLTKPVKVIAQNLNRAHHFIGTRLRQLGLVIPREIIEQRIKDSRIKPGQAPPNKGKTWAQQGIPLATQKRMLKTSFHPGHERHHNAGKNGEIRIHHNHRDRGDKPYKWIRIRKGYWRMLNVVNWEKVNGRVPKGKLVVFKDGDTMNCEPSNLELITRAENMRRNTIHRYPQELKDVIRLTNKVTKKLKTIHEKQITRPQKSSVRAA